MNQRAMDPRACNSAGSTSTNFDQADNGSAALRIRAALGCENYALALAYAGEASQSCPDSVECITLRAEALVALRRYEEAEHFYSHAVRLSPNSYELRKALGNVYLELRRTTDAELQFETGIHIAPERRDCQIHFAESLIGQRELADAFAAAIHRLKGICDETMLAESFAVALIGRGRHHEAEQCIARVLNQCPGSFIALSGLAEIASQRHELQSAENHHLASLRANPDNPSAHLYFLRYLALSDQLDRARRVFLHLHKKRVRVSQAHGLQPLLWDGTSLNGRTILLDPEESNGYGDAINFIRFARDLRQQGGKVCAMVRSRLIPIISRVPGVSIAIARGDQPPPVDCAIEMHHLWMLSRGDTQSLASYIPYIVLPWGKVARVKAKLAPYPGTKVALVWQSSELSPKNPYTDRTVPLEALAPLIELPGVTLFSLQNGLGALELAHTAWARSVVDLTPERCELEDTAAAMAAMDLVITPDSGPAHLSGAVGAQTLVMLPYASDWRWMLNRSDSPWYPSMRLFRQPTPGDWSGVVHQIIAVVRNYIH